MNQKSEQDLSFKGKAALITGGSRGIGKAIAIELACRGADIAFNYMRDHQSARRTAEEITDLGVRCLKVRAQIGDEGKIKALFDEVKQQYGRLDILVNNAASGVQRSALELSTKHWDWTMDINTRAPWLCSKEAVKLMDRQGKIVNITSLGSQRVLPYYLSVGVSKASLEALTRYLAVELAPKGISVNAVSAGYVETRALDTFPNRNQMVESSRQPTPVGRTLSAQDVAKVVVFLCTEEADMIRGQVIVVDGGKSLTA